MKPACARFLGIDHGSVRLGLAYGDEIGVATPLPAITSGDPARQWAALGAVLKERGIGEVVVGLPLNMDGTAGPKAREAQAFAGRIREAFKLPVHLVDERLTSYEAESTIAPSKRRSLRASGLVDSRAATLILQDFLNTRYPAEPQPPPEP